MPIVPRIQLRNRVEGIAARAGGLAVAEDFRILATGDCNIYKPNGEPLLFVRRKAIPAAIADNVRDILVRVAEEYGSNNRSKYAGSSRVVRVGADGSKSKNSAAASVASAVIGYIDRMGGRFPFCRATAFTANEVADWEAVVPLAQFVSQSFAENVPDRYAAQADAARRTPSEYVIPNTCFTSLTVNHNIAGRIHTDKGDFAEGFGCICVFRRGHYRGGVLCYPEYLCGVDLEDCDLIFFDPHAWHAVTDFYDTSPGYMRVSVVFYFREKMLNCLPVEEELARAKNRGGLDLDLGDE